ncbi:hypothetical protein ACVWZ3_004226 [Bradyrhizobium sp. i1.3.6]
MAAGMTSAASEISSPVGVVAGGGAMPFAVADSLAARGITPVLFPLRGACDPTRVWSNSAIAGSRSASSAAPCGCSARRAAAI